MNRIAVALLALLISSCGETENKKKDFEYKRTQQEEKKTAVETDKAPIDFSNKGIGPIDSVDFGALDDALVATGAEAFKQKCTACHYPNRKLIGPAMSGIYERRSPEWVMNMLLNPTQMLKEDPIAIALLKEYNNIQMLNQNLSQEEARAIAEYLRTL
jgi:mono/diheme cytochrome c family protein